MKNLTRSLLLLLMTCVLPMLSKAQESSARQDKFYTMSGFGFSVPVGKISANARPKFSTSVGANFGLGDGGLFLYPKISLHVFGFDNPIREMENSYYLEKGRATTYLLNVALGYRKIINKFAFYGFVGGGGGFVLTPRVMVDQETSIATLNNKTNYTGIIEPGIGIEYNLGGANMFFESSFMHGFSKLGNQAFNTVPLTIGIKPNLSRLFNKK